jgi:predicted acetylornithine/succinylornithine family transaminase
MGKLPFDAANLDGTEIRDLTHSCVMNTYGRLPITLMKGSGTKLVDGDGREYLDFVSGLAVTALGHCHPEISRAVCKQSEVLAHTSNLYYTGPQALLAAHLVELTGLGRVFFCNSGAEANEAAIKLARLYAKAKAGEGAAAPYEIISATKSFHGRTLGALAATGQTKYQAGFEPILEGFAHVPLNDIGALRAAVSSKTCAILLEPVQGEGGVYPCDSVYLKAVRELCDEQGILLIFDEIQTGLWRTGKAFAFQHYGVLPDILTSAKALGGGLPLGAMLATEAVAGVFKPGHHASTFGGNPVSCAAGLAFLKVMLEDGVAEALPGRADYLKTRLAALQERHPKLVELRGLGMILGLEYDGDAAAVVARAREKGLLANCIGGRVIRLLPPLNVGMAEIDEACAILDASITEIESVA